MTRVLQPLVMRFDTLASTNTEAARQATAGAREGLVVVAREQTAGRGRQGRAWASPLDAGLYLSIVLRPTLRASDWPLITLMSAIAVVDALDKTCALQVDVKWPNDLMLAGRKLCGILAETVETPLGRACIVGIGINLTRDAYPKEIERAAVSIEEATNLQIEADALVKEIVGALAVWYARLHTDGGSLEVRREWCVRSSYAEGKRVAVRLDDEVFEGVTRGIEMDGALRVETATGEIRIVRAGDVMSLREAGHR